MFSQKFLYNVKMFLKDYTCTHTLFFRELFPERFIFIFKSVSVRLYNIVQGTQYQTIYSAEYKQYVNCDIV